MAMTTCPNCGGAISDRAKSCVHCGIALNTEKKYCVDCGAELEDGISICPNCGCPVEDESGEKVPPLQVEVTSGSMMPKKSKRIIAIIAIFIVIIAIASVIGVSAYKKQEEEKVAAEAQKISEEYASNLSLAVYSMLDGASEAETCGNLINAVWHNAIYEERDDSTDKYTRPNGKFVSDFNDALSALFADSDFTDDINEIMSNQDTVQGLMKNLMNPPKEFEEAYEAVKEMYDTYTSFTNMVISPTGSLQTFSTNFNELDSEMLNTYNSAKLYIDD